MALALAAGVVPVPAAHAEDPPAFLGAAGQFMLIRPVKKAPWAAVDDEKGKPLDLGGDKFEVVAVSVDLRGMDKVGPFWAEKGYKNLAIRLDQRGTMMRAFGTRGLPTTFLVDHEGNVVGYLEGHADWASPEAKALVKHDLKRAAK